MIVFPGPNIGRDVTQVSPCPIGIDVRDYTFIFRLVHSCRHQDRKLKLMMMMMMMITEVKILLIYLRIDLILFGQIRKLFLTIQYSLQLKLPELEIDLNLLV